MMGPKIPRKRVFKRKLVLLTILSAWLIALPLLYWTYWHRHLPHSKGDKRPLAPLAVVIPDTSVHHFWVTGTVTTLSNASAPLALLVFVKCVVRYKQLQGLTWLQGYPAKHYWEDGHILQHPIGHEWTPSMHVQDFTSGRRYLAIQSPDFDALRPSYFQVDYDGNPAFFRLQERSFDSWSHELVCPTEAPGAGVPDSEEPVQFWIATYTVRPLWEKVAEAEAMVDKYRQQLIEFVEHHLTLGFTGVVVYTTITVEQKLLKDAQIKSWVDHQKVKMVQWTANTVLSWDEQKAPNDVVMMHHHALLSFEGSHTYLAFASVVDRLNVGGFKGSKDPPQVSSILCQCDSRACDDQEQLANSYIIPIFNITSWGYDDTFWRGHLVWTYKAAQRFNSREVMSPLWLNLGVDKKCAEWTMPNI